MQEFTDDDFTENGRLKSPHSSPTLARTWGDGIGEPGPGDEVACRDCPVAIWYWKGSDRIFCFCSAMHENTWSPGEKQPVQFCDAREQEIAKMLPTARPQRS